MEHWIPFLQSLVWPIFFIGFAFWFRASLKNVLIAIAERVGSGASFEAGPSGIKIGATQLPPSSLLSTEGAEIEDKRSVDGLPHDYYITHQASRLARPTQAGTQYYQAQISLEAESPEMLDEVVKVIYHLHPTFQNPDREISDRQSGFGLKITAWGEFNMTAEVLFKDERPRLVIERYINFPVA